MKLDLVAQKMGRSKRLDYCSQSSGEFFRTAQVPFIARDL